MQTPRRPEPLKLAVRARGLEGKRERRTKVSGWPTARMMRALARRASQGRTAWQSGALFLTSRAHKRASFGADRTDHRPSH